MNAAFLSTGRHRLMHAVIVGTLVAVPTWGLIADARRADAVEASPMLDAKQMRVVAAVNSSIGRAGQAFQSGDFAAAGEAIRAAMRQVDVAMNDPSPALFDALAPAVQRIGNAHAMLEFEGVSLPPFHAPTRPPEKPQPPSTAAGMKGDPSASPFFVPIPADQPDPSTTPAGGVSFVREVAPILSDKCGQCHINGAKGGFSTKTFAELMKGPPEGTVVYPGDVVASRLIETIETGDMPRGGGKVAPAQLATLKKWITEGAKFDGPSPDAMLTSLSAGGSPAAAMENAPATMAGKPTGKETVNFARDVAPLLIDNCNGCHLDAMRIQGGLNMETMARLLRGGDSGAALKPGKGEESLIIQRLRGVDGDRMPGGGRPPLADSEIELISKWISEGAVIEPENVERPLRTISQLAWFKSAKPVEVIARRAEDARKHFRLASGSDDRLETVTTDHFSVWGEVAPATLKVVAEAAEAALLEAEAVLPSGSIDSTNPFGVFRGLASVYVLPGRYDYSEFAKMVEGREVPSQWHSHWHYGGVEAYTAVVAGDRDDPEVIAKRLIAPVVSLAVAATGPDVPRWFADGLGQAIAWRGATLDRNAKAAMQQDTRVAIGSLKSGQEFFKGTLPPERADRLSAAVCESLLAANRKRGLDAVLRGVQSGQSFDAAFQSGLNTTPEAYFTAWLAMAGR